MRESVIVQTIVVCSCGPSLPELSDPEGQTTIGFNDVGCLLHRTNVVVNLSSLSGSRQCFVETGGRSISCNRKGNRRDGH
jgi:hypothetical protein